MPKVYTVEELVREAVALANKDSFVNDSLEDKKKAIAILNAYKENVVAKLQIALDKVEDSIDIDDFNWEEEVRVKNSSGEVKITKVKAQTKQSLSFKASAGATNATLKSLFNLGDDLISLKKSEMFCIKKEKLEAAYQAGDPDVAKALTSGQLIRSCVTTKDVAVTTKIKN